MDRTRHGHDNSRQKKALPLPFLYGEQRQSVSGAAQPPSTGLHHPYLTIGILPNMQSAVVEEAVSSGSNASAAWQQLCRGLPAVLRYVARCILEFRSGNSVLQAER